MRVLWCGVLACLAAAHVHAEETWPPARKLDAWFDELAPQNRINGSLAISEKGGVRYRRSIGFARLENGVAESADEGTRYRIGPVSRLFTAILTFQLAETASITLDTPLAEFYADVPNALRITYRDLLLERSGLADYFDDPAFATWRAQSRTHAQMLDAITAAGTKFEPRERVAYSHSNSLLLGYVLEKVRERSYDELLLRGIGKLGLARTYFAGSQSSSLESLAYAPSPAGWTSIPPSDPSVLGGAAGVMSNAGDLVQVVDALFAGKLVSARSLETMREGPVALLPVKMAGIPGVGLEGGVDGFSAAVYYFPDRRLSIAFTSNGSTVPARAILEEVVATVTRRGHAPRLP
ncbi:MAG TPA: serine hydrolase domain-containing protein [Steroidobacteraceae bacterium]|nr:serine hydrolase domain-containing protein [Steroidobacteraceae bacterium]